VPTKRLDRGDLLGRQPALARGRRAAVVEGRLAARSPPRSHLRTVRSLTPKAAPTFCRLLLLEHATDHQLSTVRRRARILVDVHPGLRLGC
jgi:hypothetical protein